MNMRKYMVYLDCGDVFKCAIPAQSEEAAREYVQGNGEVVAIKDVTEEYPISVDKVKDALENAHFGKIEINFVIRSLQEIGICE